jgi:hypothetical protein
VSRLRSFFRSTLRFLFLVVWLPLLRRDAGRAGLRAQAGQGLIEFALVILLLAVATIAILTLAGPGIESLVRQVADFVTRR